MFYATHVSILTSVGHTYPFGMLVSPTERSPTTPDYSVECPKSVASGTML